MYYLSIMINYAVRTFDSVNFGLYLDCVSYVRHTVSVFFLDLEGTCT